jgi:hypothetical protein
VQSPDSFGAARKEYCTSFGHFNGQNNPSVMDISAGLSVQCKDLGWNHMLETKCT